MYQEELYSEKADQIEQALPPEVKTISQHLPKVYLTGEEITRRALHHKGINSNSSAQSSANKYTGFIFCPRLDSPGGFHAAIREKNQFEIKVMGEKQTLKNPQGLELCYQSNVKINQINATITWAQSSRYAKLLCSAQCFYHVNTKRLFWKNEYLHDLFYQKVLFYPEWNSRFYELTQALDSENHYFRIYLEKEINFLFRLYIKYLADGWKLAPSDRYMLDQWFQYDGWRQYFNDSYDVEQRKRAGKDAINDPQHEKIDLAQALGLVQIDPVMQAAAPPPVAISNNTSLQHSATEITVVDNAPVYATLKKEEEVIKDAEKEQEEEEQEEEEEEEAYTLVKGKHTADKTEDEIFTKSKKRHAKNLKLIEALEKSKSDAAREKQKASSSENVAPKSKSSSNTSPAIPSRKTKNVKKEHKQRYRASSSRQYDADDEEEEEQKFHKPNKKQANFFWDTLGKIKKFVCKHPFMSVMGVMSLGAIFIELMKTKPIPEPPHSHCLDHYEPILSNADLNNATLMVMLDESTTPAVQDCIKEFNPDTMLMENILLGEKFTCWDRECIGADSISVERAIRERGFLFETEAFMLMGEVYAQYKNARLGHYQHYLEQFLSNLNGEKSLLEKKYGYSEKNYQPVMDYNIVKEKKKNAIFLVTQYMLNFLLNQIPQKKISTFIYYFHK